MVHFRPAKVAHFDPFWVVHFNPARVVYFDRFLRSEQGPLADIENYYYLHRDYLGSILLITDADGVAQEKRHFDAWGNIVKLTDGNNNPINELTFLDRGYTGHEHLQDVNLIHMNGRLYDPNLKRFLAPDNFIQDGSNTQNFNRYGYVLNNPLRYTDPSGEMTHESGGGAVYGAVAAFASLVHSAKIKPFKAIGDFGDSIGNFFKGIFGGNKKAAPEKVTNPTSLNSDPLAGAISSSPTELYSGSGTKPVNSFVSKLARNLYEVMLDIGKGEIEGFKAGLQSSADFITSLTTAQGWKNVMGSGIDLIEEFYGIGVNGQMLRIQRGRRAINFFKNIPNLTAHDVGYGVGFFVEKIIEGVLVSKGAGAIRSAATGGLRGGARGLVVSRSAPRASTALAEYWPRNGGALGKWKTEYLRPGMEIDRFGSGFGRYFSPRNTPHPMRALPDGNTGVYNAYRVVKPFPVQSSTIAPAFGKSGLGTQYLSPVNANTLIKRGIIVPIR